MTPTVLAQLIDDAASARAAALAEGGESAFRLFNGHLEGDGRFILDVYARTAVVFHHEAPLPDDDPSLRVILERLRAHVPYLRVAILKERQAGTDDGRRGRVVWRAADDATPDVVVREHGVRYAVDLLMNQDASFYLDTRHLRRWLLETSAGASVLNTFAYTGSLGVAARAGGAARVLHTDLSRRFLNVAKASYARNGFPVDRKDFQPADFWPFVKGMKLQGRQFDLVIVDPPFFSSTERGSLDLNRDATRLVNKVRPLVRSGGAIVLVNNSLFVSGADFLRELEALTVGGWVTIERTVGVPEDILGTEATRRRPPVVDPAPFVHSTKIVVLRVRHK